MMTEIPTIVVPPKTKIILIKAAKGYRWTIEVSHEDPDEALRILDKVNAWLKTAYGTEE